MGGSEYRNTTNKIEQTPHHRKKYYQHADTARFTWSKYFVFFFLKNVITVTSTFQTQETHHKTILPPSGSACKFPCCRLHLIMNEV